MADQKISQLPGATTPLTGTEFVPVVKAGGNDKTTTQDIANVGKLISGSSILLGRASADGAGNAREITLGTNMVMTGNVLSSIASGAGTGTVTSFSFIDGNGFVSTITNPTTTPALSLTYSAAFQSLTTTGTGAASLSAGVLNIPTPSLTGYALTASPLSQFAATTSAQLLGVINDETGTGLLVFNNAPSLTNPTATTQAVGTNNTSVATTAFAQTATGRVASALTTTAGVVAINTSLGNFFTLTLTANVTSITFSGLPGVGIISEKKVRIIQAATAFTVAFPASFKWAGGVIGVVSTTSGAVDELEIRTYDNGTTWEARLTKAFA